ncbi:Ubiquitin-conjugating enzyme E2 J2 [Hondaea fermentalgiana]|uniref:Ubiquitin-conjugating enzyme E2 J2 n=1 Tax=Hondaea fermentalgiana TaxID=2315210 RepID=A0A2R5G0R8_9STRA|nr:Ubiquitin-conjugating enzyme E2 J2 [Hondaea fermentalgiana]|eukprot:GBG24125.1 Ubiquitin-conjugating enzyme E2 J2 [Hondaea fermentalgiana]
MNRIPCSYSYEGGFYHGVLRFPKEYPYKPPSILMFTKNGRFKTNVRLCLSMSDFHPETWNPMWSVSSILSGLLSFMLDSAPTLGSMEASDAQRRALAAKSLEENVRNKDFCALFPDYVDLYKKKKAQAQKAAGAAGARAARATGKQTASKSSDSDKLTSQTNADGSANQTGTRTVNSGAGSLSWSLTAVAVLVLAASLYWVFGSDSSAFKFPPLSN